MALRGALALGRGSGGSQRRGGCMARERIQVAGAFALALASCAPLRMVRSLLAVLCLLAAHPALAQEQPAVRRWYVDLGAGINWLDQESGHPQPADTGYRLSVAGGYQMSPRWALELETGYISNGLQATQDRPES